MNTLGFLNAVNMNELLIILLIVLLLFGSKKLPELSRSIGKSISEFKKGRQDADDETAAKSEAKEEKPESSKKA